VRRSAENVRLEEPTRSTPTTRLTAAAIDTTPVRGGLQPARTNWGSSWDKDSSWGGSGSSQSWVPKPQKLGDEGTAAFDAKMMKCQEQWARDERARDEYREPEGEYDRGRSSGSGHQAYDSAWSSSSRHHDSSWSSSSRHHNSGLQPAATDVRLTQGDSRPPRNQGPIEKAAGEKAAKEWEERNGRVMQIYNDNNNTQWKNEHRDGGRNEGGNEGWHSGNANTRDRDRSRHYGDTRGLRHRTR
jgi:hypothetical protein